MLTLFTEKGCKFEQLDFTSAFIHAKLTTDYKIRIRLPVIHDASGANERFVQSFKSLYGLNQPHTLRYTSIASTFTSIGLHSSKYSDCLFITTI